MVECVRKEVVKVVLTVKIQSADQAEMAEAEPARLDNIKYHHSDYDAALSGEDPGLAEIISGTAGSGMAMPKVGRNEPCPCGSGKTYKIGRASCRERVCQ